MVPPYPALSGLCTLSKFMPITERLSQHWPHTEMLVERLKVQLGFSPEHLSGSFWGKALCSVSACSLIAYSVPQVAVTHGQDQAQWGICGI